MLKLRAWVVCGPNLVAVAVYPLRGWHTLFVWFRAQRAIAIPLPVRARLYRRADVGAAAK